jgi:hypothetical protein
MNAAKTSEKSARSLMNDQQALREADRAQAHRDELTQRIAQAIRHDRTIEPLKGLHFNRSSSPSECVHSVSIPAFCVIAEGRKKVLLGSAIAISTTRCIICLLRSNCRLSAKYLKGPKRNRTLAFPSISTLNLSVQSWLRRAISHHKGVPM